MKHSLLLYILAGDAGGTGIPDTAMALNYTQFFTRIGKGIYLMDLTNEFRGATYPADMSVDLPGRWGLYVQQYDGEDATLRGTIADSTTQLSTAVNALSSIPNWVSTALSKTVVAMLNEWHPLTATSIGPAIAELIAEMKSDGKFVNANTVTIATSVAGGNIGNGVLLTSLLDGNGATLEYVYQEAMPLVFTSTLTPGSERCSVKGTVKASSLVGQDWPLGSGADASITSCDASSTALNKLLNGGFETFTVANTPDSWTLDVGTAGARFFSEASVVFAGAKALKIAGDGSTLSALSQSINLTSLKAKTPYVLNLWAKMDSAPGAGVVTIDLYNGTSVITDESGTPNSFTIDLTTLGTSYVAKNHVFRLSEPLPTTVKLRVRQTTALSNSKNLYLDHVSLQPMTQAYAGGPYLALASGSANWSLDDAGTITVTNDYGGKLQTGFWRVLNMPTLGYILPSKADASENVVDATYIV